jgi:hypothetical protein
MSIAYIQVAFDLAEECYPGHLDGKMRISVEDGIVSVPRRDRHERIGQ